MRLHQLTNVKGAVHRRKRVGTGEGGGHGKQSGRGGKGQTARTGGGIRPGFEGGQMPLYRRLPMRGFRNPSRVEFTAVNVGDLARIDPAVTEITREALVAGGILGTRELNYKILSQGEVGRALVVHAPRFSAAARAKIEAAGGRVVLTAPAPAAKKEAAAGSVAKDAPPGD